MRGQGDGWGGRRVRGRAGTEGVGGRVEGVEGRAQKGGRRVEETFRMEEGEGARDTVCFREGGGGGVGVNRSKERWERREKSKDREIRGRRGRERQTRYEGRKENY